MKVNRSNFKIRKPLPQKTGGAHGSRKRPTTDADWDVQEGLEEYEWEVKYDLTPRKRGE